MKFLVWLLRILIFIVLLILALANTQEANLNFLAGLTWTAPLILIGLAFFVAGMLAGLLTVMPSNWRRRVQVGRLNRELKSAREAAVRASDPPSPPLI